MLVLVRVLPGLSVLALVDSVRVDGCNVRVIDDGMAEHEAAEANLLHERRLGQACIHKHKDVVRGPYVDAYLLLVVEVFVRHPTHAVNHEMIVYDCH